MSPKVAAELKMDDEVFEKMREELSQKYSGKWVTVFKGKVVAIGETYDESAAKARRKYGEKLMVTRKVAPKEEERYWIL